MGSTPRRTSQRLSASVKCCSPALIVLLWFLAIASARAQQASATINGTVMDSSGAVVDGAEVTLINSQTGVSRSTVSNSAGNYVFVDVLPSTYSMKVVKEGFSTLAQSDFTLYVNQTATFDFHLTLGSTQQSI